MQSQRRKSFLRQIVDPAAQLAQGVDQIRDGPLVHARDAAQIEAALLGGRQKGEGGRERTHGCPGVAQEKLGLSDLQLAAQAIDSYAASAFFDSAAERAQRVEHHPRVVGVEQVVDDRAACRQPGQQQHPVGDAFRTGQAHAACGAVQRRQIDEGVSNIADSPVRSRRPREPQPVSSGDGHRMPPGSGPPVLPDYLPGSRARAHRVPAESASTA